MRKWINLLFIERILINDKSKENTQSPGELSFRRSCNCRVDYYGILTVFIMTIPVGKPGRSVVEKCRERFHEKGAANIRELNFIRGNYI